MDKVQTLLSTIDGDSAVPDVVQSTAAAAPSATSVSMPKPLTRTKIVFIYSDEDNEEDAQRHDDVSCTGDPTRAAAATQEQQQHSLENITESNASLPYASATARVVACSGDLQLDAAAMLELQADAQAAHDEAVHNCGFEEDVIGAVNAPPLPEALAVPEAELALARVGIRARVVPVTPHVQTALRHGLTVEELARFQGRRRLRSDSDEDEGGDNSDALQAVDKRVAAEGNRGQDEAVETGLQAIVDESGSTVRAIRNGPYCLTVEERDLIEEEQGSKEELGLCEEENIDAFADAPDVTSADEHCLNGNDDDDDSDDDCELDECLVVAVVEQLVRCCESEELDPKMQREASRFLSIAKPLLTQLEDDVITSTTFAQLVDREEFVLHRMPQNTNYKPSGSDRTHAPAIQPTKLSAAATPFVPHTPQKPTATPPLSKSDSKPQLVDPLPLPAPVLIGVAEPSPSSEGSPSSPANPKSSTSHSTSQTALTETTPGEPPLPAKSLTPTLSPQPLPTATTTTMMTTTTTSGREGSSGGGRQEPPQVTASPVQWDGSRLPGIFGCANTKTEAPAQPIPLHSVWDFYADDHSGAGAAPSAGGSLGGGGGAGSLLFDPVHVATVEDLESFWRLWRYVPLPSSCPIPFTYSWFRKDVKPEWESPRNKRGGIFTIIIFDRDRPGLNDKQVLDDTFMTAIIGCTGETFSECSSTINGIMLKLRPNKPFTMQLWTSHSEHNKLKAFANSLRESLGKVMEDTKSLQKMEYYSHHRSRVASNSLASRLKAKPKVTPDYVF